MEGPSFSRLLARTKDLGGEPYACLPNSVRLKDHTIFEDDVILFERLVEYWSSNLFKRPSGFGDRDRRCLEEATR
jgi:hypothetical protein